jgi:hypothetical protein
MATINKTMGKTITEDIGVTEMQIDNIMKELRDFIDNNSLNSTSSILCVEAQDLLRRAKYNLNTIECFNCSLPTRKDIAKRWYHGDQDDLVCLDCARKLKHTDTAYAGLFVSEGGN